MPKHNKTLNNQINPSKDIDHIRSHQRRDPREKERATRRKSAGMDQKYCKNVLQVMENNEELANSIKELIS